MWPRVPVNALGDDHDPRVERYTRALAAFGQQVAAVGDTEWDLPTPCVEWDVRTLVTHVVLGEAQVPVLLAGGAVGESVEVDAGVLGHSPVAAWRGTALAAIRAVSVAGALDRTYDHPSGPVTGAMVLGFRLTENVVHGWDLATAIGHPFGVEDDLVEACIDHWYPLRARIVESGLFGPGPRDPGPDATPLDRLLALLGRGP